jgi:hypothetical protein
VSDSAAVDAGGSAAASRAPENLDRLRSMFESYNELVRTEGDVLRWVQEWFDPQAQYRPIEDPEWFSEPEQITRSIVRWIETWGVRTHRIEPQDILDLGNERFLISARNSGVGRGSGVPIEAMTYMAQTWRRGKLAWFDEYLDKEAALAALEEQTAPARAPEPALGPTFAERVWKFGDAAFAAFVRRRSDRQLERLFGSGPALRAIFRRMEQLFEPAKAGDFSGEIQYELLSADGVKKWVVVIDGGRAITRADEARAPATTVRMRLPLFIRVVARELHPVKAYREGDLEISGDFDLAARATVMFGLSE